MDELNHFDINDFFPATDVSSRDLPYHVLVDIAKTYDIRYTKRRKEKLTMMIDWMIPRDVLKELIDEYNQRQAKAKRNKETKEKKEETVVVKMDSKATSSPAPQFSIGDYVVWYETYQTDDIAYCFCGMVVNQKNQSLYVQPVIVQTNQHTRTWTANLDQKIGNIVRLDQSKCTLYVKRDQRSPDQTNGT